MARFEVVSAQTLLSKIIVIDGWSRYTLAVHLEDTLNKTLLGFYRCINKKLHATAISIFYKIFF